MQGRIEGLEFFGQAAPHRRNGQLKLPFAQDAGLRADVARALRQLDGAATERRLKDAEADQVEAEPLFVTP